MAPVFCLRYFPTISLRVCSVADVSFSTCYRSSTRKRFINFINHCLSITTKRQMRAKSFLVKSLYFQIYLQLLLFLFFFIIFRKNFLQDLNLIFFFFVLFISKGSFEPCRNFFGLNCNFFLLFLFSHRSYLLSSSLPLLFLLFFFPSFFFCFVT